MEIKEAMELIWPEKSDKSNIKPEMEIRLPKELFVSERIEDIDEKYLVHSMTRTVFMKKPGVLVHERSMITYDSFNIAHNTGAIKIEKEISFDELQCLIKNSKDERASKYTGMNAENWRSYVAQPVEYPDPTKYPTVKFGKYKNRPIEWYMLSVDENKAILWSKDGLETKQWHHGKEDIPWTQSDLCHWLNKDFWSSSFSISRERDSVLVHKSTGKKINLISEEEVDQYLKNDGAVVAKPTANASGNGAFTYTYSNSRPDFRKYEGNSLCWLRDLYSGDKKQYAGWAKCIYWDGSISMYSPDFDKAVVRPLILLNLETLLGQEKAGQLRKEYLTKMQSEPEHIQPLSEVKDTKSALSQSLKKVKDTKPAPSQSLKKVKDTKPAPSQSLKKVKDTKSAPSQTLNCVEWHYRDEKYGDVTFYAEISAASYGWFITWGCKTFPDKTWESIGGGFGGGAPVILTQTEFLETVHRIIKYGSETATFKPLWDYLVTYLEKTRNKMK